MEAFKRGSNRDVMDLPLSYWPVVWPWHHTEHLIMSCEPPGCLHDAFQSVFGVSKGCGVPHSDREGEETLCGGSVELGASFPVFCLLQQSFDLPICKCKFTSS